jgi:hypothetical protein
VTDGAELVLRFGRSRFWYVLAFGVLLAVCAGSNLRDGRTSGWLYLIGLVVLFGVYAWAVTAPGMQLCLSAAGLAYGTMRRLYFFRRAAMLARDVVWTMTNSPVPNAKRSPKP